MKLVFQSLTQNRPDGPRKYEKDRALPSPWIGAMTKRHGTKRGRARRTQKVLG